LLFALAEGEKCVSELAKIAKVRDSTVSQHLAMLRATGAAATRRKAQNIFYRLASKKVARLLEAIHAEFACTGELGGGAPDTPSF